MSQGYSGNEAVTYRAMSAIGIGTALLLDTARRYTACGKI